MTTSSVQPARGTRDFLPADVRRRQHVIDIIRGVYERYGFEPLETPAFENIETLLGKYGEEGNQLIFKILRRGEHESTGQADLALRYDLTVPLARVVAQHQNELPKFFKRYQIQPVWRADRPARGRFREFYQCDIDAIGSTSPIVEVEQMAAVADVLGALGFRDFAIRLNHRRLLAAILDTAGVPPHQQTDALVALDKLDKIGPGGVTEEFARRGLPAGAAPRLLELTGGGGATFLRAALKGSPTAGEALDTIDEIVALAAGTSAAGHLHLDTSLARGLSYYTGAIMEIAVEGIGSLGGGGRYDGLVGMFLGRDVPACGFSLGLERIIVVMTERGMFPETVGQGAVDVMVTLWNAAARSDALALAADFRRAGLRAEVYPEPDKLGKQFKYAAGRLVPLVAIVGDDERARGEVTLKDLRSAAQESVPRLDAAAHVRRRIDSCIAH
ncbi:MAG: histidine--tRNA ligase [Acidobacteriota bacterium]